MTALEVEFDLLEQAASIARTMARRVKLVEQSVDRGRARVVSLESHEIGVHHPLGVGDGARTISGGKADDEVNGFAEVIHSTGIADRR